MKKKRKPTLCEIEVIEYLADKAKYLLEKNWKEHLEVVPLTDWYIGSLQLLFDNSRICSKNIRCYEISNCMFYDQDGVGVALYLLVNEENIICELDMWKGDYSPISEIPPVSKMIDIMNC